MSDLTEKLWPAFYAEVTEQLEAIELSLVGRGASSAVDVNALFRHFHTIKGGCAMMGYANMGALAHASEDVLDPVRKSERALDEPVVDALLLAVDGLKQQMQAIEQTRQDPPPRTELIERLRELVDSSAPVSHTQRAQRKTGQPSRALAPAADANAVVAPDVHAFAVLVRPVLADLMLAGLADGTPGKNFLRLLARLQEAAEATGLVAIARLSSRPEFEADNVALRRAILADILDRLSDAEVVAGIDCGVAAAALRLRESGPGALQSAVSRLSETIGPLIGATDTTVIRQHIRVALVVIDEVLTYAILLQLPHTTRLLRMAAQIMRDMARGSVELDNALTEQLIIATGLPSELLGGLDEDATYITLCMQLQESLQQVAASVAGGREVAGQLARIKEQIDIRQEVLDTLLPRAVQQLQEAIARHETIVEIEADMESTTDFGEEFVVWLSNAGTLISNHTVFHQESAGGAHNESTRLRFLAALPLSLEEIKQALGELDPERHYFDLHPCSYHRAYRQATSPAPDQARTPAEPGPAAPAPAASTATLRIDSATLDQFVNRVGEMVMLRNMMSHALYTEDIAARQRKALGLLGNRTAERPLSNAELAELRTLLTDLERRHERLTQADLRIQGALGRMQEDVLALRVVPIGMVFNRLPRVVRDVSHAQRKQVNLEITGEDVRIDKSMVEILIEPLMHLVRNAIDHGVETPDERAVAGKPVTATLLLSARQQGNTLLLEVADDGRGLNLDGIRRRAVAAGVASAADVASYSERELANLIFLPGFSTTEQVTEVSGRGVGMDVVKTRVTQMGGQVDVQFVAGKGTTFTLRLPLSVAIQSVILVAAGERQWAIPERNVAEVVSLPVAALQTVQGQACCLLRGVTLPLYNLAMLLGTDAGSHSNGDALEVVIMTDGIYRIGLLVDRILGRPEVFVRDIHPDLARLPGVGGASILGDGRVVIILDCDNLFELALSHAQSLHSLLRAS